jgi:LysM repeat protein
MARQTTTSGPAPRLCPTCGTRVGLAATKCLVCGADLTGGTQPVAPVRGRPGPARDREAVPRSGGGFALPSISLPLPAALAAVGLFILFGLVLILGANGVLPLFGGGEEPTETAVATPTAGATLTPAPTSTVTPAPSSTPLPPVEYTVKEGDTIGAIAVQFDVGMQSILDLNGLGPADPLQIGQVLQIPQPTPTLTPEPSSTLEFSEQTAVARPTYIVQPNETFDLIARVYNVDPQALMEVNNIVDPDQIRAGQILIIPVDRPLPTVGPTPTGTAPPPYAAPQLLSPADGAAFVTSDENITLQWATVDILREDEVYFVTVVDVTCNCARELHVPTASNRLIVPPDLRPDEALPHVFRWTVVTARRTGTDANGQPIYEPAGATSDARTFTWIGGPQSAAPPSPSPTP